MGILKPTFEGHVATRKDALILFEACLRGQLSYVARRLTPSERRRGFLESGSVFISVLSAKGLGRWVDGANWRSEISRYRHALLLELEKGNSAHRSQEDRDKPALKKGGLMKQTFTASYQGTVYRLTSYVTIDDVKSGRWITPTNHPIFGTIAPRRELIASLGPKAYINEDCVALYLWKLSGYKDWGSRSHQQQANEVQHQPSTVNAASAPDHQVARVHQAPLVKPVSDIDYSVQ
ncbi:Gti1/Pac2 family-domain-containing protein [Ilyonectria destructans]|nr:Gti1/Pac2 family-domain-containing protein [Ilyonectria destructans]